MTEPKMNIKEITGFECCFCKKGIEKTRDDPVDMNLILNEDMQNRTGIFQNFYAHFLCLKSKLHKDVQGYFIGNDN